MSSSPVGVVSDAPGRAAVAQAHAAGLDLDEWQQRVLIESLGVRADGKWAAFSVGLLVPRQNGKGAVLEALALAMLFQFGAELVVWTAHEMKTAKEGFRRLVGLITSTPDLARQVKAIRRGNDDRGVELWTGARIQFLARSSGSGRGFSGDCIILDEAYKLDSDDMAALLPTLSAVPNPQIWYTSSAPMATSEQLHKVRARGVAGDDPRLAFFEWSMPEGDDPSSPRSWAIANPGYPLRIDDEAIEAEWREFGADADPHKFARERCGVPDLPAGVDAAIGAAAWDALVDPDSQIAENLCLALDVSPDLRWATIGAAGRRRDGLYHVETVDTREGTAWIVHACERLAAKVPVRIQVGSPAAGWISKLRERRVEVLEVSSQDHAQAVVQILDAVKNRTLRHLGALTLTTAATNAEVRPSGDVELWARRSARVNITPIVAVTLALGGVPAPTVRRPKIHTLTKGAGA